MGKWVYSFGAGRNEGKAEMRNLLGGKGANLAEMCKIGIPVPPGFTITTEVCAAYYDQGKRIPEAALPQIDAALKKVEQQFGKQFGDPADPLLVIEALGRHVRHEHRVAAARVLRLPVRPAVPHPGHRDHRHQVSSGVLPGRRPLRPGERRPPTPSQTRGVDSPCSATA